MSAATDAPVDLDATLAAIEREQAQERQEAEAAYRRIVLCAAAREETEADLDALPDVLAETRRTPDDFRADLRRVRRVRDLARLAAEVDERREACERAKATHRQAEEQEEQRQAEAKVRITALRKAAGTALRSARAAEDAERDLARIVPLGEIQAARRALAAAGSRIRETAARAVAVERTAQQEVSTSLEEPDAIAAAHARRAAAAAELPDARTAVQAAEAAEAAARERLAAVRERVLAQAAARALEARPEPAK